MYPENESLTPYLDSLSPVLGKMSPDKNQDLGTKTIVSGDSGDTGDKLNYIWKARMTKSIIAVVVALIIVVLIAQHPQIQE
jgi:hypothetical protein